MVAYPFPNDALPVGSAAYYLIRFAPAAARQNLSVVFAWFREVEGLHRVSDTGVALTKLRWWQEELDRVFAGRPTHPLGQALTDLFAQAEIEPQICLEIVQATKQHLTGSCYPDGQKLYTHYCETWGNLARLFSTVLRKMEFTEDELHQCGAYYGMVDGVRRLGGELSQSRPRMLAADIEQLQQLRQGDIETHIAEMCERLAGFRPKKSFGRGIFSAMLALSDARLEEIRRNGSTVVTSELDLTPLRTLWIVWRAR